MKNSIIFLGCLVAMLGARGQLSILPSGSGDFTYNTKPKCLADATLINNAEITGPGVTRYHQFIEFGDGYFAKDFKGTTVPVKLAKINAAVNYKPLVVTYGIYTPKPPSFVEDNSNVNVPSPAVTNQKMIATNKTVALIPSIDEVVTDDIITYAIPFKGKLPSSSVIVKSGSLVFLYNKNDLPVFKADDGDISVTTGVDGNQTTLNPVRGLGTAASYSATLTGSLKKPMNPDLVNLLRADLREYENYFVVDINNIADQNEHNIFISLIARSEEKLDLMSDDKNTISVKAYFLPYNGKDGQREYFEPADMEAVSATVTQSYSLESRDPNNTWISPRCNQTGSKNKTLTFYSHITNEGPGVATKVWIKPVLQGINFKLKNIILKKVYVGGKDLMMSGELQQQSQAIEQINVQTSNDRNLLGINFSAITGTPLSYVYKPNGNRPILSGLPQGESPETFEGKEVVADIVFTAEVDSLPITESKLTLVDSVWFGNPSPIITPIYITPRPDTAFVKNSCSKILPGPEPAPCDTFWCKYWWLILLGLLLLTAIIIFGRRNNS